MENKKINWNEFRTYNVDEIMLDYYQDMDELFDVWIEFQEKANAFFKNWAPQKTHIYREDELKGSQTNEEQLTRPLLEL